MKRFPSGAYGRQRLTFFPAPYRAPLRAFAVLVFPWVDDQIVLCDIADRGWCIPSGRVEAGEASEEAARREAREEAGIELDRLQYIGCYKIDERGESRWADCFTAAVASMQEIGLPEESLGRKVMELAEVPAIYHLWNDLTEKVFEHAQAVQTRSDRLA